MPLFIIIIYNLSMIAAAYYDGIRPGSTYPTVANADDYIIHRNIR